MKPCAAYLKKEKLRSDTGISAAIFRVRTDLNAELKESRHLVVSDLFGSLRATLPPEKPNGAQLRAI